MYCTWPPVVSYFGYSCRFVSSLNLWISCLFKDNMVDGFTLVFCLGVLSFAKSLREGVGGFMVQVHIV